MRISNDPSPLQILIDQKQVEHVEYFSYLGSIITNGKRCTREIKFRITMAKVAFNRKKTLLTRKLKKEVKCYVWSIALHGAEIWTLRKVDQKYLESLDIWCWRSMEKINCTDRVRNEEVLHSVKKTRNILNTMKRRKVIWIGHMLGRTCLLEHIIERKKERRQE